MSEFKHTPGPWVIVEGHEFEKEVVITTTSRIEEFYGCICDMYVSYDGSMGEEQKSNARLIAAAPELLDSLLVFLRDYEMVYGAVDLEMQPALYQARAAIAKATTQQEPKK